jgi:hypothetical protein
MTAATDSSWGRSSPYGMSKSFSRTAYMTASIRECNFSLVNGE